MAASMSEGRVRLFGFHGVLQLLAILSAYEFTSVLIVCFTSGLLGVFQFLFLRMRKSAGQREEEDKLSVLCSADLEDDLKSGHSNLVNKLEADFLLHGDHICFGAGSSCDGCRTNAQTLPIAVLNCIKNKMKTFDENLKKHSHQEIGEDVVPDEYATFKINPMSKKLKDSHVSEDMIRNLFEACEFPGKYFGDIQKEPVEHLDMSFDTLPRNHGFRETFDLFSYSACMGSKWMGCSDCVLSDGNGTQKETNKCNGNQKQSGSGTALNQEGHKRQQCGSGTSSSTGSDDDGEDDEEKRHVKIPQCCQTSAAIVVPKPEEEKPAGTGEEAAALSTHRQQPGTDSSAMLYDESASGAVCEEVVSSLHSNADLVAMTSGPGGKSARAPPVSNESHLYNELEDWHSTLIKAFECQRNFGSQGSLCTDGPCVKVRELVTHCGSCRLHVYGGCPECAQYCDLMLYHAQHCRSPRCIHQCMFVKEYIQVHAVPDVQNWSLSLDKLFFQPEALDSVLSESAVQQVNRSDCSRFAARGPVPNDTLTIPSRSSEPKVLQRPNKQLMPWAVSKGKFSVTDDGHYDENHEWFTQVYIGGGRYGRCYQCRDKWTGFLFAVKKIRLPDFNDQELEIWQSLSGGHPNIVELYGATKTDEYVILFMEFMNGGSVHELLEEHSLAEPQALDIVRQVMSAVDFMHTNKILHRDIKGANALVDDDGRVKLADFGTAVKLTNAEFQPGCHPCGTEAFMAPEVCRSEDHSFSADVWSILCLLYQLLTGQPPWQQSTHDCYTLLYIIGSAKEPPGPPQQCSAAVADLFCRGFRLDPSKRETIKQLLHHQVFALDPVQPTESSGCASAKQLPPEEQLSSLQSDLLLATLQNQEIGDFFLAAPHPTPAEFDHPGFLDQLDVACAQGEEGQCSRASASAAAALPETAAYSVRDSTKVHILKANGELLFTVRHSPFTTYGALAGELHEAVADQTGLRFFTLTQPDGGRLQVFAVIGPEEQRLKVESAYDMDSWQGWRVDHHGLVEQRPCG